MASIDSVQQIVASIRAEMTARVNTSDPKARAEANSRQKSAPKTGSAVEQRQRMGNLIGQRVKALDPDDPKRGKKAFRIFLESVLLAEFGETLINDPAFYQLVDDVQKVMEQDPEIGEAISKAVNTLLEGQTGN